jgi:hypothetical protein
MAAQQFNVHIRLTAIALHDHPLLSQIRRDKLKRCIYMEKARSLIPFRDLCHPVFLLKEITIPF